MSWTCWNFWCTFIRLQPNRKNVYLRLVTQSKTCIHLFELQSKIQSKLEKHSTLEGSFLAFFFRFWKGNHDRLYAKGKDINVQFYARDNKVIFIILLEQFNDFIRIIVSYLKTEMCSIYFHDFRFCNK